MNRISAFYSCAQLYLGRSKVELSFIQRLEFESNKAQCVVE